MDNNQQETKQQTFIARQNVNLPAQPTQPMPAHYKARRVLMIILFIVAIGAIIAIGFLYSRPAKSPAKPVQSNSSSQKDELPEILLDTFLDGFSDSKIPQRFEAVDEKGVTHTYLASKTARTGVYALGKYEDYFKGHNWQYTVEKKSSDLTYVVKATMTGETQKQATIKIKEDKQVYQTTVLVDYVILRK